MSVAGCPDAAAARRHWRSGGVLLALLAALPVRADDCGGPLRLVHAADPSPATRGPPGPVHAGVAAVLAALHAQEVPLQVQAVPADRLAEGHLPPGTEAVLGWSRQQLPPQWPISTTYLDIPQVIVRRRDDPPILDLGGLRGQSVASPDPATLAPLLARQAPGALLLPPTPLETALRLLVAAQVDAVVANLVDVDHLLRQGHEPSLQVAAPAGFDDTLVLATTPACSRWLAIINSHLAAAPSVRATALAAREDAAPVQAAVPAPPWLRWLAAAVLALLGLGLVHALGYWRLHRETQRRRGLQQRLQEVSAGLPAVVYRARRSCRGEYSVPYIAGDVHALFGMSVDAARVDHRRLLAAVHPDDRGPVMAHVDAAALVRGPIDVTFRSRGRMGWRWVRSHGRPVACSDGDGSGVEWSGYWMDVTEAQMRASALNASRREAEQAVVAKAHFLASMSEQIGAPMNTVVGMLNDLAGTALDPRQRQLLATLEEAAIMLRQILDDVLDSERQQAGEPPCQAAPTDLPALLRGVQRLLAPLAASKGLHLQCVLDPALQAGTLVDGLRLRQILFNLAGNALKFTSHGGVELRLQVQRQDAAGQHVRLQVADTGVGISPARQRAVFAPYTQAEASITRRFGGSGLGLAICRELAAALGGDLQLHSIPGKGTTVSLALYLPACDAPPASAAQAVSPPVEAGSVGQ
ncbi:ATP-binding protein [Stenotrophomonas sp. ESTM1D_MKCIP4_1]|uniref:sensor histidine kinase n=1 Tax=Stenotrophomonas sp. ESTM1D_MKCIP4_1 TaxID=2072414 RepID=UPI0020B170E4|nr:ATP-binding protein [Stenotrophomonas sp. ESTM1D_MKCIP4_1]